MIYTVGHSTLEKAEFLKLLGGIDVLMDIRSHPGSNRHPQFNKAEMEVWVPAGGVEYQLELGLGGWRDVHAPLAAEMDQYGVDIRHYCKGAFPKHRIATARKERSEAFPAKPEWTNRGLYEYSIFELTDEFLAAADRLMRLGEAKNVAIMCCESLWWKCHRSMVSDYLAWRQVDSLHILGKKPKPHSASLGNRLERYDPRVVQHWESWKSHSESKQ